MLQRLSTGNILGQLLNQQFKIEQQITIRAEAHGYQ